MSTCPILISTQQFGVRFPDIQTTADKHPGGVPDSLALLTAECCTTTRTPMMSLGPKKLGLWGGHEAILHGCGYGSAWFFQTWHLALQKQTWHLALCCFFPWIKWPCRHVAMSGRNFSMFTAKDPAQDNQVEKGVQRQRRSVFVLACFSYVWKVTNMCSDAQIQDHTPE